MSAWLVIAIIVFVAVALVGLVTILFAVLDADDGPFGLRYHALRDNADADEGEV